jgi:hypothetical protein
VLQVLNKVEPGDRDVALCLCQHSAVETAVRLGISRASVYRSIGRLRSAFTDAGFGGLR